MIVLPSEPRIKSDRSPWPDDLIEQLAADTKHLVNEICCICLMEIKVMAFKNTGVCCEQHRKDRDDDHAPFKAVGLKIHEGEEI